MVSQGDLNSFLQQLYAHELPAIIDSLRSMDHLPTAMRDSIETTERNIAQSKKLIEPFGAGIAVGAVGAVGGVFGILAKKQHFKKLAGKRLVAIQDNATQFSDTVARLKQLMDSSGNTKPDYAHLTVQEKRELLLLSEEMKTLSEKLTEQLAA